MLELHYNLSKECCVLQLTQPAGMHWWLDTSSCCYIQVAVRWMAFGVNIHTTKREEKETSREGRNLTKTGFHSYFLFLCQVLQYKVIIQLQNANTRMKASFEFEFSEEQKKNNSTCNCTFIACTRPIFHQTWNQIFWKNLVTSDLSQLTSSNISKIPDLEKVKSVA